MSKPIGIVVILAFVGVLGLTCFRGYGHVRSKPLPNLHCGDLTPQQAARSYALAQIIQSTAVERTTDSKVRSRQHHTYLVVPLAADAGTPFKEWYTSSDEAQRLFRHGSNGEKPIALGQDVEYGVVLAPGPAPQILETGADYVLADPIPARSTYSLNENEDFQSYKNVEDVICAIRFLVWSTDYDLELIRVELSEDGQPMREVVTDGGIGAAATIFHDPMIAKTRHESAFTVDWPHPLALGETLRVTYRIKPW